MSLTSILTKDTATHELTDLFCQNQRAFYSYIAKYAASNDNTNENDLKPLRFHTIENTVDCIFSPKLQWSFYNAILQTDISDALKQNHHEDSDKVLEQITSIATHYKCPVRLQVKPSALETQKLLKRYGFFEMSMKSDSFQYIDLYHTDTELKQVDISPDIKIYEVDESTQMNASMRKSQWGYVLCESFGFRNPDVYGPFYSNVWSRVKVGPCTPIRMFIAMKNDHVVGGCHVSLACGIACLFNVTTLKNARGNGIGKALSLAGMISAKESGYRYMVLQGSDMGLPIYKKLGFKTIPSYKLFLKLTTAAWYYKIIEIVLVLVGFQRLQQLIQFIRKPSKTFLLISMVLTIITGLFLARMFT